jgi:hypothetical protein
MVALRYEELAEMDEDERKFHFENEAKNVFGADYKRDRHGRPVEMGIGSKNQPTINSMGALLAAEGVDAYNRAVAECTKLGTWPPVNVSDESAFKQAQAMAAKYDPSYRHREPT